MTTESGRTVTERSSVAAERAGSRRSLRSLLGRTLLVGLFCFFAWCALAFLSSGTAAAGEHDASSGLLPGALRTVDGTTRAVGETATATLGGGLSEDSATDGSRDASTGATRGTAARGDAALDLEPGTPPRTAAKALHLLAPVRATVVDINQPVMSAVGTVGGPVVTGARAAADGLRPVAATLMHPVANALQDVAGKVRPVLATPVLAGVALATDEPAVRGAAPTTSSVPSPIAPATDGPRFGGDERVAGVDAGTTPATGNAPAGMPDRSGDTDELPLLPVGQSAPGTSSSSQAGGTGQAGNHAYAEPISVLAASGPTALIRPTDDDPCSDEQERPSVSPD